MRVSEGYEIGTTPSPPVDVSADTHGDAAGVFEVFALGSAEGS